jgi:hypothetical protein
MKPVTGATMGLPGSPFWWKKDRGMSKMPRRFTQGRHCCGMAPSGQHQPAGEVSGSG